MAQKINLNPSIIKILIMVSIGLIVGLNVVVFFLGKNLISENAKGLSEVSTELQKTQQEIDAIESIRNQMKELHDIPELIDQSFVKIEDNRHQEKIIETIKSYAQKSKLTISSITFPVSKNKDNKNIVASVNFQTPTKYRDIINFVKLTEAGNPRMQIIDMSISLSVSDKKGDADDVNVGSIQIQLYGK